MPPGSLRSLLGRRPLPPGSLRSHWGLRPLAPCASEARPASSATVWGFGPCSRRPLVLSSQAPAVTICCLSGACPGGVSERASLPPAVLARDPCGSFAAVRRCSMLRRLGLRPLAYARPWSLRLGRRHCYSLRPLGARCRDVIAGHCAACESSSITHVRAGSVPAEGCSSAGARVAAAADLSARQCSPALPPMGYRSTGAPATAVRRFGVVGCDVQLPIAGAGGGAWADDDASCRAYASETDFEETGAWRLPIAKSNVEPREEKKAMVGSAQGALLPRSACGPYLRARTIVDEI